MRPGGRRAATARVYQRCPTGMTGRRPDSQLRLPAPANVQDRFPPPRGGGRLNPGGRGADSAVMTIAPSTPPAAAGTDVAAVVDVTALLPNREALLVRLAERLVTVPHDPAALLVVGLLRRDDGWPTPASTLAAVTTLLARSLRGDDWLGASGAAEFAIVLSGSADAAAVAAGRLTNAVAGLGIPGLSAAAGIASLDADLGAQEVFRRATLSLTAARGTGPLSVVRHREPA